MDPFGAPRASGGLCATTRDLARLGQLVLDDGRASGKVVVPQSWIRDIFEGGSHEQWRQGSFAADLPDDWYRSLWYKHGADVDSVGGFGIFGQAVYIHPASRVVIAKHSSQPSALDFELDALQQAAFEAIAAALA